MQKFNKEYNQHTMVQSKRCIKLITSTTLPSTNFTVNNKLRSISALKLYFTLELVSFLEKDLQNWCRLLE
uniref:Uncharacterized protein n=1 Tax=Anguilla anguilla TaxID=7936 RepID=A0A0E9XG97_ANGAN